MAFTLRQSRRPSLRGRLQLARLLEAPETDIAARVGRLERDPLFGELIAAGVVAIKGYAAARLTARRFDGYGLRMTDSSLGEVLDGNGETVQLMLKVGQETFEEVFLRAQTLTDCERAIRCDITLSEARQLRELVDKLYIQEEFSSEGSAAAPSSVFSCVAGFTVDAGRVCLGFFNRDIWKGRYLIDDARRSDLLGRLSPRAARRASALLRELEFLDRRKSTLYQILEVVAAAQEEYMITRDPAKRRPLPQSAVAARVGASPSVVNRIISNKSVEMPWGLEVPMRHLFPSRKSLLREQVQMLAVDRPNLNDREISDLVENLFGIALSRQSIYDYRRGVGAARSRTNAGVDRELVAA